MDVPLNPFVINIVKNKKVLGTQPTEHFNRLNAVKLILPGESSGC